MHRVLIVEDDEVFAQTMQIAFARAGFDVDVATTTFDALNKADAGAFDVMVVDIEMPAGSASGLSFARMIRYRNPKARIIFVTGYPELGAIAAELPDKVFVKPVDFDALVAEMRQQLGA